MYQPEVLKRWLSKLVFVGFTCLYLFQLHDTLYRYQRSDKIINEDAFGYYAILPAYLQYHDPNWRFLDTSTAKQDAFKNYIPPIVNTIDDSLKVCKYYSGPAMMQLPFYAIAEWTKRWDDPFDQHHQFYILLSVIFYVLVGFFILYQQLLNWQFHPLSAGALIAFTLFGTNLFVYTAYDPAYSHAYSFFAFAAFAGTLLSIKRTASLYKFVLAGLCYGLIVSIRPLNAVVIFLVPIIFYGQIFSIIKRHPLAFLLTVLSSCLFPFIQSYLWHWQTGQWYVYPYGNESLNLAQPQLFEFIFGYNCGWALYTPGAFLMVVLGLAGLVAKRHYGRAILSFFSITATLYLMSCWYYLHYGCTAGCRPITDYYGLFMLMMAYGFRELTRHQWIRYSIITLLSTCFIYWRIVQYQFFNHIINWCDMDKDRLSMVFLKTHEVYHYSTYPFWDFSMFSEQAVIAQKDIKTTIKLEPNGVITTIELPEIDNHDSSLLLTFDIHSPYQNKDAYLRFILTDNDEYVEQQTLLLHRKTQFSAQTDFQFFIKQGLKKGLLEIRLETTGSYDRCEVFFDKLRIQRIKP